MTLPGKLGQGRQIRLRLFSPEEQAPLLADGEKPAEQIPCQFDGEPYLQALGTTLEFVPVRQTKMIAPNE